MMKMPYDYSNHDELLKRYYDYNTVYGTPEGKRVIDDLIFFSAIDRTGFTAKSESQTFFNLGKQSMGYHIENVKNHLPQKKQDTTIKIGEDYDE